MLGLLLLLVLQVHGWNRRRAGNWDRRELKISALGCVQYKVGSEFSWWNRDFGRFIDRRLSYTHQHNLQSRKVESHYQIISFLFTVGRFLFPAYSPLTHPRVRRGVHTPLDSVIFYSRVGREKDEMSLNLSFFNINYANVHEYYRISKRRERQVWMVNDKKKMRCNTYLRDEIIHSSLRDRAMYRKSGPMLSMKACFIYHSSGAFRLAPALLPYLPGS